MNPKLNQQPTNITPYRLILQEDFQKFQENQIDEFRKKQPPPAFEMLNASKAFELSIYHYHQSCAKSLAFFHTEETNRKLKGAPKN